MSTNILDELASEYVKSGIACLQQVPRSRKKPWFKRVDLETLEQASTKKDVLGQLFGDYWSGLVALGLATEAERQGFRDGALMLSPVIARAALCGFALGNEYMTWKALNEGWRREIESLRHPA